MRKLFLLLVFFSSIVLAANFDTGLITTTQPNGTTNFIHHFYGNEFRWHDTTNTGYAIIKHDDEWYVYAQLNSSGEYTYTTDTVGIQSAPVGALHLERTAARDSVIDVLISQFNDLCNRRIEIYTQQNRVRSGTWRVGTFYVDFTDRPFYQGGVRANGYQCADFDSALNAVGGRYFDTVSTDGTPNPEGRKVFGSVREYYLYQSRGTLDRQDIMINPHDSTATYNRPMWIHLPNTKAYYDTAHLSGGNIRFLWEVFYIADSLGYNWEGYDSYRIVISRIYGTSGYTGASVFTTYYPFNPLKSGKILNTITQLDGEQSGFNSFLTIGTTAHEFGHILGAADEYSGDISYGWWDLMGLGSFDGGGDCPASLGPEYRATFGWLPLQEISNGMLNLTIDPDYCSPFAYLIYTKGGAYTTEHYIFQTQTRLGFDEFVPNSPDSFATQVGVMSLWHTDRNFPSQCELLCIGTKNLVMANGGHQPSQSNGGFWPYISRQNFKATNFNGSDGGFVLNGIHRVGNSTVIDTIAFLPDCQTGNVSVNLNQVTFSGQVNANHASTNAWFFYRFANDTLTVDSTQATQNPIIGNTLKAISKTITLSPNTAYNVKVIGYNLVGKGQGSWVNFTTSGGPTPTPPIVVTLPVTNITDTTATANGTVKSVSSQATNWILYGKDVSTPTDSVLANPNITPDTNITSVSYNFQRLSRITTYYVWAAAKNTTGYTRGNRVQFTTLAGLPLISILSETLITQTTVRLRASVNPNGAETTVKFFIGDTSGDYDDSLTVSETFSGTVYLPVTKDISGLTAGTKYYVIAKANNLIGITYSTERSFTTNPITVGLPDVEVLSASNISYTTATLSGIINCNNGATAVKIYWGTTDTYSDSISYSGLIGNGVSVSHNASSLNSNTRYFFNIKATNSAGETWGQQHQFTTLYVIIPDTTLKVLLRR